MERSEGFWRSSHPGAGALRGAIYLVILTLLLFSPGLAAEITGRRETWVLVPMMIGIFTGIGAIAWLFSSARSVYDYLCTTRVARRVIGGIATAAGAALCIYVVPDLLSLRPGTHRRQAAGTAFIAVTSIGLFAGGGALLLGRSPKRPPS